MSSSFRAALRQPWPPPPPCGAGRLPGMDQLPSADPSRLPFKWAQWLAGYDFMFPLPVAQAAPLDVCRPVGQQFNCRHRHPGCGAGPEGGRQPGPPGGGRVCAVARHAHTRLACQANPPTDACCVAASVRPLLQTENVNECQNNTPPPPMDPTDPIHLFARPVYVSK